MRMDRLQLSAAFCFAIVLFGHSFVSAQEDRGDGDLGIQKSRVGHEKDIKTAVAPSDRLLRQRPGDEFTAAFIQAINDFESAKAEVARLELLSKSDETVSEKLDNARRTLESKERKYQILKDNYRAAMRDLQSEVKQVVADLDVAEYWAQRVEAMSNRVAVPQKTIQDAKTRMERARLAAKQLTSRYELFKAVGKGLIDEDAFDEIALGVSQFVVSDWGLRFATQPIRDDDRLRKTKYRGGMQIVSVRPGSPAANNGFQKNDILVGLDKWETTNGDNITWIVNNLRQNPGNDAANNKMRFFVIRGQEVKYGFLPASPELRKIED